MFRLYPNEIFREITLTDPLRFRYAVSNRGRMVSFTDTPENGTLLKGSSTDGYRTLRYKAIVDGKPKSRHHFIYKHVAALFIPKTSEDQTYVLHLDFVRDNDDIKNLRWATRAEMLEHTQKSPHVQKAKLALVQINIKRDGTKLTSTKVIRLKKLLNEPKGKTRLKMLAKQFGISETHVKRIQRGENWGHIIV